MKRLVNRLSGACLYVLLALIVGMSSCEDDANDWTVDKNYDALFRPLTFDKSATDATSVTLRYSQIVNAKVYIFEFYTDSLEFNAENYVRTDTILKDTLTVFSESNTPMRMEYRTLFQEFNGSTQYSVRMKGEDAQGKALAKQVASDLALNSFASAESYGCCIAGAGRCCHERASGTCR